VPAQFQPLTLLDHHPKRGWEGQRDDDALSRAISFILGHDRPGHPRHLVGMEMSLHVLAYNLKRMIAMLGSQPLIEAIRT